MTLLGTAVRDCSFCLIARVVRPEQLLHCCVALEALVVHRLTCNCWILLKYRALNRNWSPLEYGWLSG